VTTRHGDNVRQVALEKGAAAKSAVAASWSRSLLIHGLDPDQREGFDRSDDASCRLARERMGRIAAIARPAMDRLFASVGDTGCAVVLTDHTGLIVERRGSSCDDQSFREWGLWTGAEWSEAREGTNGIGTCLVEQRPVTIHRDQHFRSGNAAMSCMGAPIFDHEGELAGALDISSCRADLTEAFVALLADSVADAARRVEAETFQHAFAASRVVMAPGDLNAGPRLLAVDQDDLLIGATRRARKLYGLSRESFANPRPVRDFIESRAAEASTLDAAERAELRRALAHTGGNVAKAARYLGIGRATLYRRMGRHRLG